MAALQEDGQIRVIDSVHADESIGEDNFDIPPDQVLKLFKKFVKEFKYETAGASSVSSLKYREQFMQNLSSGINNLELSINDLNAHNDGEILSHAFRMNPTQFVPLCERGLQELYEELVKRPEDDLPKRAPVIQLHLTVETDLEGTFGSMKPMMIRDLNSTQVEKLVVIQGVVTSVRTLRHKARKMVLKCKNCENVKEIHVNPGYCAAHIPSACTGNPMRAAGVQEGVMEKCGTNPFVIQDFQSEFVDEQVLKLQELPEHVPVGEMPRAIELCVQQYSVDQCTPGTRLTVVGIFCATEHAAGDKMKSARQKGTNTVKFSYVQVLGVQVTQGTVANQNAHLVSSTEEEYYEQLARDPEIHSKIFKSIAPAIRASEKDCIKDVKQAVACLLFGGSRKQLADGTRMRGDINVLLLGDPGTAKSQFLKFAEKVAPIAVYTSGKGSSAAGLTAAIKNDRNGFSLEGGAMVLADGGVVCIDEFDKMDVKDRVAIHEAMEQQTISIAKAGITTMLNTRCSVLAAANPRFGTYDDLTSMADQMDFETTILSRFDMMFNVRDVRDEERDYELARHLVGLHSGEVQQESEGPLPVPELRKYISFCRSKCSPRLSAEATDVLKNHYVSIRKAMRQDTQSAIPITVRQLEAIIRISESMAKMELVEDVSIAHVEEALRLFTVSTLESANKDRGVGIETMSDQEKADVQQAEEQVRKLIAKGSRTSKFNLERLLVQTSGIDEKVARKALHIMTMRGELEERANGSVQRAA